LDEVAGTFLILISSSFNHDEEMLMNMADMLIYVHPEFDAKRRHHLENWVSGCIGVDCAEFNHHPHPHSLIVKYDPDTIQGKTILNIVRRLDPAATMVGL
jgi:hypothetical protein